MLHFLTIETNKSRLILIIGLYLKVCQWVGSQNFLDPEAALIIPSPALITLLPDKFFVNKSPSKETPKIP